MFSNLVTFALSVWLEIFPAPDPLTDPYFFSIYRTYLRGPYKEFQCSPILNFVVHTRLN